MWQQWQSIYLYPEKESSVLYLVMLLKRSTGTHSSPLAVHAEIVDFLLFLEEQRNNSLGNTFPSSLCVDMLKKVTWYVVTENVF